MNLTVGPLPPAVYWRRRAIVAGALFVIILLIVYACGGSGSSGADGARHTAVEETHGPTPSPSLLLSSSPSLSPRSPSPSVSDAPSTLATSSTSSEHGTPTCSDRDIKVTATIESTSASTNRLQYGGTFSLQLRIQNISDHACSRDVGGVLESLTVSKNGDKVWSSDDCDSDKGAKKHDVRVFPPNVAILAQVNWNSYLNTSKSCVKRKTPAAKGKYQLVGRVGSAASATTTFTIE